MGHGRKDPSSKGQDKKGEDLDFEISFYESILKKVPGFVQVLIALGDLYTKKGQWQKGLEVDLKLAQMRPDDPMVFYNLACSYSLLNDTKAALLALRKAFECGYDDFDYLRTDQDLENLLKDTHFQEYLRGLKKKKKTSSKPSHL